MAHKKMVLLVMTLLFFAACSGQAEEDTAEVAEGASEQTYHALLGTKCLITVYFGEYHLMLNTKIRLLLIAFMLFSAILAYPAPAWGCSCDILGSPEEEFVRVDAVFVGRVARGGDALWNPLYTGFVQVHRQFVPPLPPMIMEVGINDRAISFEVEDSWRGVKTTQITVRTPWEESLCGYRFQQGKQYLVYAYEWDGTLYAILCSRTAPLASAAEDLNYLQTLPKLELTYIPPMFNLQMLCLAIPFLSAIVLGVVIWRRRYTRKR